MALFRRLFGSGSEPTRSEPVEKDGHVHAPDADPDDVVLPKQKRSSQSLIAGKPPAGWRRHASDASGGIWPCSGGEGQGASDSGGSGGDSGGSSGGGD